jgi:isopenicillin N synthase-like dioxygenase
MESDDLDKHPVAPTASLAESVPILDIGGLQRDSADLVVQDIAQACIDWGFFQVVNHGVPDELIERTWQQTRHFFALPQDQKDAVMRNRENPWGYYNNELTKNQRDKKQVFDYTADGVDPIYHSSNRWPDANAEFRDTMREYLAACTELSLKLLRAFCVGLDLPANHLHDLFVDKHTGFIRLNYYPVEDPMQDSTVGHQAVADLGVHHHTDAGALTVLMQDSVGGLQVHRDRQWHNIPPVDGAFVINTGDMMQVWSNDRYKAAIHRVLAMENQDRYSIPFFFNPADATAVYPLSTVTDQDNPAKYRSINWTDYRGKRTDGDYADYGTEVQISQYRI